jgi:eukaryotic-like serine/threonine-protein kinase
VDAIALKALEKDRSRRYATPSELAADIGRYFGHEPVLARRAGAGYRVRKYIRRHRVGVAVAATAAVLLLSAAVAQTLALRRVTRERDRADRIAAFTTGMFKVSDPSATRGNTITAREILDKASKEIGAGLSKDPVLQAQMMHFMADVYANLGLYSQTQSLLTRAVDIRRRVLGPENPDTLSSMSRLARMLSAQSRHAEAEKLLREALDTQRRVLGPEHSDTLLSMNNLANLLWYQRRYAEAEKLHRETLDIRRRLFGPEDMETLHSIGNLAIVLDAEGRHAEAEKLEREALGIQHRVLAPGHRDIIQSINNMAVDLAGQARYAEAGMFEREMLEIKRDSPGAGASGHTGVDG